MEAGTTAISKVAKKKLIPVFDLFENSWKMYWANLKSLITISLYNLIGLAAVLVGAALIGGLTVMFSLKGQDSLVLRIILLVLIAATALGALAVAIWYSTRSKIGTYLLIKNNFSSVKDSWQESKKLFGPFFILSLLVFVLLILWALLLIIPAIIFGVFYSFAVLIFIFDGKKGIAAIKASRDLVKGYWWPVFGRLVFLFFILYLFSLIIGMPGSVAVSNEAFSSVWSIVSSILMFIASPFLFVYTVLLFKNLKEIKN